MVTVLAIAVSRTLATAFQGFESLCSVPYLLILLRHDLIGFSRPSLQLFVRNYD